MSLIQVVTLDHIAIEVPSVEDTMAWYIRVLGLRQVHPEWAITPARMVTEMGTGLALFPRGEVRPHIAFRVSKREFEAAQPRLAELGIDFEVEDHGAVMSMYFNDPNGQRLELTYNK